MSEPTAQDAQNRLQTLLRESGVDVQSPPLADFWPVFKQFAAVDFGFDRDEENDGFLVEYFAPSKPTADNLPRLNFVRQFTYNDAAGVYCGRQQMVCAFYFDAPLDDPDISSVVLWSFGMTLDEYFRQVEAMPVFRAALNVVPVVVKWVAEKI